MSAINLILAVLILVFSGCLEKDVPTAQKNLLPTTQYSYMGGAERSINLKLNLNKSEISLIKATISTPYDYNAPLQYKWKLGSGVILNQGSLTGTMSSLKKDQTFDIVIAVKNFNTKEPRFVRFEVFGTDANKRIFSDGIVSSNQESSFESVVQEVEKNHE